MKRTSKRTIGSGFERLEDLLLCAGDVYLSGHTLHYEGTAGRDNVSALLGNGNITVYENNRAVFVVDEDAVDQIVANMRGGNDTAKFFVRAPVVVNGGAGDDVLITGTSRDTIIGGAGQDSVRGGQGSDIYRLADGDYDRIFGLTGNDVVFGERYNFGAWHRFLSTPNVNAYRGNRVVVTREYVDGYGDDRLFYTVDVDARNGHFEDLGGLQQMAVGYPPGASPGGLRVYVPITGGVQYVGFNPEETPFVIQTVYVT